MLYTLKKSRRKLFSPSKKVAKSINVEVGINMEGWIFWKKLVYKCNKRGVKGGKNLRNQ